ncbi:hypothetical protein Agsp01_14040 [Agromyces sp. NBRC 114283]|nr:hypothetical protein Agsp01_14040 [Agromyces sp. NBRC 114283]
MRLVVVRDVDVLDRLRQRRTVHEQELARRQRAQLPGVDGHLVLPLLDRGRRLVESARLRRRGARCALVVRAAPASRRSAERLTNGGLAAEGGLRGLVGRERPGGVEALRGPVGRRDP